MVGKRDIANVGRNVSSCCVCMCSAWLDDKEDPILARMTFKAATLNNLTSYSSEQFQVVTQPRILLMLLLFL